MKKLSGFDFSELEVYIDNLERCTEPDDRRRDADIIEKMVCLLPTLDIGQDLIGAAGRYALFGDDFSPVRRAFAALTVKHSGWSAAKQFEAESRAESQENGKKGGRPPTGYDWEWLIEFNRLKQLNRALSDTAVCRRIACEWVDGWGKTRKHRTIMAGIRREQKRVGK